MRYDEALNYLLSQLPMFQRVGAAAYKADLSNTLALADLTDHPERAFRSIHVAGTNGKGSVSHLLASVFQQNGYKTGLFTSPHLKDFRERIRINGQKIDPDAVARFVTKYRYKWEEAGIQASFFEITAIMAFDHFREEEVDIAIIETGMGGRLDSTNIITPEVAVITNVGLDHQKFLGDTVPLIATEKAGIIKPGVPVVIGEMTYDARQVCAAKASELGSELVDASFLEDVPRTPLIGQHQLQNARTACGALQVMRQKGWELQDDKIALGFARVKENTGLRGRWEVLSEDPLTIADVGHNVDGIRAVLQEMQHLRTRQTHMVLGMSDDKDSSTILSMLPRDAYYYFCKPDVPRGKDAEKLMEEASVFGLKGEAYGSVSKAYAAARLYASEEDLIFIGGSFFVVAEVI